MRTRRSRATAASSAASSAVRNRRSEATNASSPVSGWSPGGYCEREPMSTSVRVQVHRCACGCGQGESEHDEEGDVCLRRLHQGPRRGMTALHSGEAMQRARSYGRGPYLHIPDAKREEQHVRHARRVPQRPQPWHVKLGLPSESLQSKAQSDERGCRLRPSCRRRWHFCSHTNCRRSWRGVVRLHEQHRPETTGRAGVAVERERAALGAAERRPPLGKCAVLRVVCRVARVH